MARWWLVLLLVSGAVPSIAQNCSLVPTGDQALCKSYQVNPGQPWTMDVVQRNSQLACNYTDWALNFFTKTPDTWKIEGKTVGSNSKPLQCRHCYWSLGYPLIAPFILSPPLNCTQFLSLMFLDPKFNASSSGYMSYDDFKTMWFGDHDLMAWPNPALVRAKRLDPDAITRTVDLNQDGQISIDEWLVCVHFWAPVIWSQSGPSDTEDQSRISDGSNLVSGGFYYDFPSWQIWLAQGPGTGRANLNRAPSTTSNYLTATGGISDFLLQLREPEAFESMDSFFAADLDRSGRYTLSEHYFRNWADTDGDGRLSRSEFINSLYYNPSWTSDEGQDRFSDHDSNQDQFIWYVERKFYEARQDLVRRNQSSSLLPLNSWTRFDFPQETFRKHDTNRNNLDIDEFQRYATFWLCTLASTNGVPDSFFNTNNCSVSAFQFGEGQAASFNSEVWKKLVERLGWLEEGSSFTPAASRTTEGQLASDLQQTAQSATRHSTYPAIPVGIISSDSRNAWPDYVCSQSFLPGFDGFVMLVPAHTGETELLALIPTIVVGGSFLQFLCTVFLSVLGVGHLFWMIERNANSEQFDKFYTTGVLDGLYFSTVTLTTVGYGDKTPVTPLGKMVGVVWMFIGVILFSIFTGEVTSLITEIRSSNQITGFDGFVGTLDIATYLNVDVSRAGNFHVAEEFADINRATNCLLTSSSDCAVSAIVLSRYRYQNALFNLEKYSVDRKPSQVQEEFCNSNNWEDSALARINAVGDVFEANHNRICIPKSIGFLAERMIGNINAVLEEMQNERVLEELRQKILVPSFEVIADCSEAESWPVIFLSIVFGVAVILGSVAFYFSRKAEFEKRELAAQRACEIIGKIFERRQDRARWAGLHWLRKTREGLKKRAALVQLQTVKKVLDEAGAIDRGLRVSHLELSEAASRLGVADHTKHSIGKTLSKGSTGLDPIKVMVTEMVGEMSRLAPSYASASEQIRELHEKTFQQRIKTGKIVRFFMWLSMVIFAITLVLLALLMAVIVEKST